MLDITYYKQNVDTHMNNFAAFIKNISVHSITSLIILTLVGS